MGEAVDGEVQVRGSCCRRSFVWLWPEYGFVMPRYQRCCFPSLDSVLLVALRTDAIESDVLAVRRAATYCGVLVIGAKFWWGCLMRGHNQTKLRRQQLPRTWTSPSTASPNYHSPPLTTRPPPSELPTPSVLGIFSPHYQPTHRSLQSTNRTANMPYYEKSEDWLKQSSLLIEAHPVTVWSPLNLPPSHQPTNNPLPRQK